MAHVASCVPDSMNQGKVSISTYKALESSCEQIVYVA